MLWNCSFLSLSLFLCLCPSLSVFMSLSLSLSLFLCLSVFPSESLQASISLNTLPHPTPTFSDILGQEGHTHGFNRQDGKGHTSGFNRQVGKGSNVWNLLLIFNHNARKLSALTLTHSFPLSSCISLSPTHLLCGQRGSQMWGCLHRNP